MGRLEFDCGNVPKVADAPVVAGTVRAYVAMSPPVSPRPGTVVEETDTGRKIRWTGSGWVDNDTPTGWAEMV